MSRFGLAAACFLVVASTGGFAAFAGKSDRSKSDDPAIVSSGVDLSKRILAGPVVVRGKASKAKLKARVEIFETLRGEGLGREIMISYRGSNLMRPPGDPAFAIREGEEAIFVLGPWVDSDGEIAQHHLYRPEGGFRARIPIPAEGGEALLDAVRKIVAWQDSPDRSQTMQDLVAWLAGKNPYLIDVALDQAARHVLCDEDWLPALFDRARDVSPWRRERVLEVLGGALARGRFDKHRGPHSKRAVAGDAAARVQRLIIRLARTDPEESVRMVAVRELARAGFEGVREILEAVAKDDPSQDVRYEASAALARGERRIRHRKNR